MSRLAFFSPLPPAPTGIADYSVDVVRTLSACHAIDLFHGQPEVDGSRLPPACRPYPAESFFEREQQRPYDLAVYQLGNGPAHAFLYPFLARAPGLLVLHELVLHHARARSFLESPAALAYARDPSSAALRARALADVQRYREELAYSYPAQAEELAAAQLDTVGELLPYAYPLFRLPVEASRATAAHNGFMLRAVRDEVRGACVVPVSMPLQSVAVPPDAVARVRSRHAIALREQVIASFGLLTREKGIDTLARALARLRAFGGRFRLLLVGPVPDPSALWSRLTELGLRDLTVMTGRVPLEDLPAYIEAADVVVHLRYPTARETSAALLRVLAQGRATIVSDLENLAEIPDEAVWRADPADEEGAVLRGLLELLESPGTRERLGRAAAAYVARRHSGERCLATYEAAIEAAQRTEPLGPLPGWPAHWSRDRA